MHGIVMIVIHMSQEVLERGRSCGRAHFLFWLMDKRTTNMTGMLDSMSSVPVDVVNGFCGPNLFPIV